jgi:hypothetical protein
VQFYCGRFFLSLSALLNEPDAEGREVFQRKCFDEDSLGKKRGEERGKAPHVAAVRVLLCASFSLG